MAHNFFHQRDTFRRFYFDLSLFSSSDWRISHVLSHHTYTNTLLDLEISMLEPFMQFLPSPEKSSFGRYGSYVYHVLFYLLVSPLDFIKRIICIVKGEVKLQPENLLPILQLITINLLAQSFSGALWLVFYIHFLYSNIGNN